MLLGSCFFFYNFFLLWIATPSLGSKIAAGLTTGGVAVLIGQPTEVVKVRLQAQSHLHGLKPRYTGTYNAYRIIATTESLRSLWKGNQLPGDFTVLKTHISREHLITELLNMVFYFFSRDYSQSVEKCHHQLHRASDVRPDEGRPCEKQDTGRYLPTVSS